MKKYICEICNISFLNFQSKANHVRWNHKSENFYEEFSKTVSLNRKEEETIKRGSFKKFQVICENPKCNQIFYVEEREKDFPKKKHYYCNRSCANTRKHDYTKDQKKIIGNKVRKGLRRYYLDPKNKEKIDAVYLKPQKFNSKGEREVRKYFLETHPEDHWSSGGVLLFENLRFSRDLYSNKLKICIEYDGIWHFQDIRGQLVQKQLKDKLLEEWCIQNNFRLIRIKDELYLSNKEFWIKQLENAVYNRKEQIIKFYE